MHHSVTFRGDCTNSTTKETQNYNWSKPQTHN